MYNDLEIPINEKKSVKSQLVGEVQGGIIGGDEGIIFAKPDKFARYLRGAWYLLQSKKTNHKRIQMVAGGLVYLFSYRRCLMRFGVSSQALKGKSEFGKPFRTVFGRSFSLAIP